MKTPQETIGLIGVGLVGSELADRFVRAGFAVAAYDIDPRKIDANQTLPCASPAEVTERARRIVLSLPDSKVVNDVVEGRDGIAQTARSGDILIDTTTADPTRSEVLAKRLAERNISFLDATILGSSRQVRDADVLVMVGGDLAAYDRCVDIFNAFAHKIFHMGPAGKGAEAKLVVNLVLGLNRLVLAEGLVLGQKLGIDLGVLLDVLKSGGAYARVMDVKGEKMRCRDFEPQARLAQHLKDVDLILDLGARTDTPLPVSALHAQLLRTGVALGLGDRDNAAVVEVLRTMAGIK